MASSAHPKSAPLFSDDISPKELHAKRVLQAKERAERIRTNHAQAKELASSAEKLCEKGKYTEAVSIYAEASRKWNTNIDIFVDYSDACLHAEKFAEAEILAQHALNMNPRNISARFFRGVARMKQCNLIGAKSDFCTILKHCPGHSDSLNALEFIASALEELIDKSKDEYLPHLALTAALLAAGPEMEEEEDVTPRFSDVGINFEDISDSEDSKLRGNEVACRHYNKKDAGCKAGLECKWLHGADCRSVRDKLGRNVCSYSLFGKCRFGAEKCFYSHDKTWLPNKGWWKNDAQIKRMKDIIGKFECDAKAFKLQEMLAGKSDSAANEGPANPTPAPKATQKKRKSKKKRSKGKKKADMSISSLLTMLADLDLNSDEHRLVYGFTEAEVEELMWQGVKPWGDDARDVMHFLLSM